MNEQDNSSLRLDLIMELREVAERNDNLSSLVTLIQERLGLNGDNSLISALAYFRAAFFLTLREVLPIREWLAGQDRSEIDSILIPAMNRTRKQWQSKQLQQA